MNQTTQNDKNQSTPVIEKNIIKLQDESDVMPMDIDAESNNDDQDLSNDVSAVPQVDLESELREFLENDTTSLVAADDVSSIDQMLMS